MTYLCLGLRGVVELPAPLLTGSSPIFVVLHNLSAPINLIQRNVTCLSEYHRTLYILGPLLYLLYTAPISDVIASHHLNYHLYADDTQLYLAFETDDVNLAVDRVVNCLSEISCWMEQNDLKLNPEKTDILLIYSWFRVKPALDYLQFIKDE